MRTMNNKKDKKTFCLRASPCVAAAVTAVRKRVCFHPTRHQRRHFVLTKLNKNPQLRCGEQTHFVLNKKPSGQRRDVHIWRLCIS